MSLGELHEMFAHQAWARDSVDAVLLLEDLTQRESFLAGESTDAAPAVLTPAQARNEAPLPETLQPPDEHAAESTGTLEADRLWSNYFRYVVALSRGIQCPFLREWAQYEVGLRNALAVARAQRLGLAPEDYCVAKELESFDDDFDDIVSEWLRSDDPLKGYRLLIRARWDWVGEHERWFSFRTDELAAYSVKLILLHQAYRLSTREEQVQHHRTGDIKGEADTQ